MMNEAADKWLLAQFDADQRGEVYKRQMFQIIPEHHSEGDECPAAAYATCFQLAYDGADSTSTDLDAAWARTVKYSSGDKAWLLDLYERARGDLDGK